MSESSTSRGRAGESGRRSTGGGWFGSTGIVAVLVPLLALAAAYGVRHEPSVEAARPPTATPLSQVNLVCPGGAGQRVLVANVGDRSGASESGSVATIDLGGSSTADSVEVPAEQVAETEAPEVALGVSGQDSLAVGLVATRSIADRAAVAPCPAAGTEQWFTGVGARADLATTLELANPDPASAVVDVEAYGDSGPIDAPRLRGIRIPGSDSVRVDLAAEVPERSDLALRVVAAQGRVVATAYNDVEPIGLGTPAGDWLPTEAAPARSPLLLGLPEVAPDAERTLLVANPGDDEARVSLRVVDERSVFEPTGVRETRVPPHSVREIDLGGVTWKGVTGLQLEGSQPVLASLRTHAGADLSYAAPGTPVSSRAATVLPTGPKSAKADLVLAGATKAGVVTVVTRDADGKPLAERRVEVAPNRSYTVSLPAGAATLEVVVERSTVAAAVRLTGPRTAVVPLTELVTESMVPDVRPGDG